MALNWTMINANRAPVPINDEMVIKSINSGVEISLNIPDAPPTSSSATAGGVGGSRKLKADGSLYLTDNRLIFIASTSTPTFDSLSVPLLSIISSSFEQPLLGSNYLQLHIRPSPEGGLTNGTKAEIRMRDRGLFEFVATLEKTRERAIYQKRDAENLEDSLPVYEHNEAPQAGPSTATFSAAPDGSNDLPPGYDV